MADGTAGGTDAIRSHFDAIFDAVHAVRDEEVRMAMFGEVLGYTMALAELLGVGPADMVVVIKAAAQQRGLPVGPPS